MLKNAKLGMKIGSSFGLLILITLALGVLATVSMKTVQSDSDILANEYMPQVELSNEVERNALQAMFNMRGYTYTEGQDFLDQGMSYLDLVDKYLDDTEVLSKSAEHLGTLADDVAEMKTVANRYRELADINIADNKKIADFRAEMDRNAALFMNGANEYLQSQNDQFDREAYDQKVTPRQLDERHNKITLINDIIDIGNAVRIGAWKSLAQRSPQIMEETIANFALLAPKFEELQSITRLEEDKAAINQIRQAGVDYETSMQGIVGIWAEQTELGVERVDVANRLLALASELSEAGVASANTSSSRAASQLSVSASSVIVGLAISLLLGALVAVVLTRSITKPINFIAAGAKLLSQGDIKLESLDHNEISKMNERGDELGDVGRSFSDLIANIASKTEAADEISKGNLGVEIKVASEQDVLGHAMVEMRNQINALIDEMRNVARDTRIGKLNSRGDLDRFNGAWEELVSAVNDTIGSIVSHLDSVPAPVMLIDNQFNILYMNKSGAELGGKTGEELVGSKCYNFFKTSDCNTENCACHKAMSKCEVAASETDAHPGDLNLEISYTGTPMCDSEGNVLGALEVVSDQTAIKMAQRKDQKVAAFQEKEVEKLYSALNSMADGDLTVRYDAASGDNDTAEAEKSFSAISKALNATLDSLNDILAQVMVAVEQVTSGATQVSSASQSLSQGATEQASSLEEVSSSMTEVGSQTKMNAENATQANQLAESAKNSANQGNQHMVDLLKAMEDINDKSAEVQKIVKAIDEIAFQTNLLALNAAVEAARAGVHGKGFAVVAEEVRNLAQRSAKAAKETTDLIEGNVAAVTNGSAISDQTAKALQDILEGSTKVTDLVNEIASASKEQTEAVDQISEALGQIDQVTQSNTASAEESAAAAEELSGQAENLSEMVRKFKLKDQTVSGSRKQFEGQPKLLTADSTSEPLHGKGGGRVKLTQSGNGAASDQRKPAEKGSNGKHAEIAPEEVIQLDDADFGDF